MLDIGKFEAARCTGIDDFIRPTHLLSDQTKIACNQLRKFVDKEILPA